MSGYLLLSIIAVSMFIGLSRTGTMVFMLGVVAFIIFGLFAPSQAASPLPDNPMTTNLTFRQAVIMQLSLCRAHYLPQDPIEFSTCVRQGILRYPRS